MKKEYNYLQNGFYSYSLYGIWVLGKKLIEKGYGAIKNVAQSLGEELRRTLLDHSAVNYLSKRVRITFEDP